MVANPIIEDESEVVLSGVSWDQYEAILEAIGEYHLRHFYANGTLSFRSVLYGVDWQDYQKLLRALSGTSLPHIYDRGTLEMMSPLKEHDWIKRLIGRMIESMALELDIDIQSVASMTVSNTKVARGIQPDESYYVGSEPQVRHKIHYDPDIDPPPDLVLEVDVTSKSKPKMRVLAGLKIPEVWQQDGSQLTFFHLARGRTYRPVTHSIAFPFLTPELVERFVSLYTDYKENDLIRKFLREVKKAKKAYDSANT